MNTYEIDEKPSRFTASQRQRITYLWSKEPNLTPAERNELRNYERKMR